MLNRIERHMLWLTVLTVSVGGCGDEDPGPVGPELEEIPNACAPLGSLRLGDTAAGTLVDGDCPHEDAAPTDRWELVLSQTMDVRVDLTSDAFDTYLEVYRAGQIIAADDDGGMGTNSRMVTGLASGTYTLVVRGYHAGSRGPYQLSVSQPPDCSPVGVLALGQTVTGTFHSSDCLFYWGGLTDRWTFELGAPEKVRLRLSSEVSPVELSIQDPAGNVMHVAWSDDPARPVRLDAELQAGTWTVLAMHPDEAMEGAYELSAEVAPACDPGTAIVLGEAVSDALTDDGCLFVGWAPADSVGLTLDAEAELDFQLKSPDFEPFLLVRDASGADVVAAWPNAPSPGIARARVALPPGSYAVFVVTFDDFGPLGSYELLVSEVDCGEPGSVAFGTVVEGTLDAGDCMRAGGAHREVWHLELEEEHAVRIGLTSESFDPYLILLDEDGSEVARNDDGGPGFDARIDETLAAGQYEIVVTTFQPGQTGAYALEVGSAPAAVASGAAASTEIASGRTEGGTVATPKVLVAASAPDDPSSAVARLRVESMLTLERIRQARSQSK